VAMDDNEGEEVEEEEGRRWISVREWGKEGGVVVGKWNFPDLHFFARKSKTWKNSW
jgi:hypothetical protein